MTEHRLTGVHIRRIAHATGQHDHHRRTVRIDGSLVAYWACRLAGGGPCPDLPPPAVRPRPEPIPEPIRPDRRGCQVPDHEWGESSDGKQWCKTCARDRRRAKAERAEAA